jgi:5-formyltetrahydrofolate cyclo-ligase
VGAGHSPAKTALRDQVRAARRRRPLDVAARFADDVAVGSEPGTGLLLDALVAAGKRVLLPVVLPDLDLDWAVYDGPAALAPAARGLYEPTGPRLGRDAIRTADVVLVPGLGVSPAGERLGQGGGCYDRVLPRVPAGTPVAVVLFDDEVGVAVPAEPHDVRVGFALTAGGVTSLSQPPAAR